MHINIDITTHILNLKELLAQFYTIEPLEIVIGLTACCIGIIIGRLLVIRIKKHKPVTLKQNFLQATTSLITPFFIVIALHLSALGWRFFGNLPLFHALLIKITLSWFFIALILLLANRKFAGWFITIVILPLTIINLFGIWGYADKLINFLNKEIIFKFGVATFSLYQFIKTVLIIVVLSRLSKWLTTFSETRLSKVKDIRSSNRVLIIKVLQILLYCIIFIVTLSLLHIPLTALAVFGGAIGVGVGFGLQKVAANFISGIILLLEKTIEIGDIVELKEGINGVVKHTRSRYTLVETAQGKEILVPNEEFITQRVVNWTYSNHRCRVEIPIQISSKADVELAQQLILQTARARLKDHTNPEAACYLNNLGEKISFVLSFWIDDIVQGYTKIQHEILLTIWHEFKKHNIALP